MSVTNSAHTAQSVSLSPWTPPSTIAAVAAFAVATVNVGASSSITVTADTAGVNLPVLLFVCQTTGNASCVNPPASSVTVTINTNATPTFSVFVAGFGIVPFNPADNRVFVRFKDPNGVIRGSTSVAVRTQ